MCFGIAGRFPCIGFLFVCYSTPTHISPETVSSLFELVRASFPVHTLKLILTDHLALHTRVRQFRLKLLPTLNPSDPLGRSCQDKIALFQLHDGRNKCDEIRDSENHVCRYACLLGLTVDGKVEADFGDIGELGFRDEWAASE